MEIRIGSGLTSVTSSLECQHYDEHTDALSWERAHLDDPARNLANISQTTVRVICLTGLPRPPCLFLEACGEHGTVYRGTTRLRAEPTIRRMLSESEEQPVLDAPLQSPATTRHEMPHCHVMLSETAVKYTTQLYT